jgi:hypothetical protein
MHWSGKMVLISGGVCGIARAFARPGVGLVLMCRNSLAAWPQDSAPDERLPIERQRRAANRKAAEGEVIAKADLT